MDWSWLLFLMCPLMMIPMMFMMMKGNHSDHSQHDHQKNLAEEMEQLKRQNETMQKELHDLKNNA
jgi:hypothetical protein